MTIEEFDNTKFGARMIATIGDRRYDIASVNFDQRLIGVVSYGDPDEIDWYRCENCEVSVKRSSSLFDQLAAITKP